MRARPRKPPVRITKEKRAEVINLLKEGRSLRYIQLAVGCAPNTANLIRKKEKIERPICRCGRPGGHRGVCVAQRRESAAYRPHSPKQFSGKPARTNLGKLLDAALVKQRWLPTDLARKVGMTGLKMTQIRLGALFAVIVSPRDIDKMADALEVPEAERIAMHYAAACDFGYRLPPLHPATGQSDRTPRGFSMLEGRLLTSQQRPWRRLDTDL